MARQVLIISPRFPPVNAPDLHRARFALPYFERFGWKAHVLCLETEESLGVPDPSLLETVPADVPIHRVRLLPPWTLKPLGIRGPAFRSVPGILAGGCRQFHRERFDLVYFSTTMFLVLPLGRIWRTFFAVPYVVDMQDPWVNRYYAEAKRPPPGGAFRFGVSQLLARLLEPGALQSAAHITCVSEAQIADLRLRYPRIPEESFTAIPFPASRLDFEAAGKLDAQPYFDPEDGLDHWVSVGRLGVDMEPALDALFSGIARLRKQRPAFWNRVRLHFIGTSYAPTPDPTALPRAARHGIADLVREHPQRVPYLEALRVLQDGKGALLFGSEDDRYRPSKLAPYLISEKPLLAITRPGSALQQALSSYPYIKLFDFSGSAPTASETAIQENFEFPTSSPLSPSALREFLAEPMTERLCTVFDKVLEQEAGLLGARESA